MAEGIETKPYVLTADEAKGVAEIRDRMGDVIPPELNTDLNLRRWVKGWKGKLDDIEPRFRAMIENRHAAGFDREDFMER